MNVEQDFESAWGFVDQAGTTLPCALDADGEVIDSYTWSELGPIYAPFPFQVVIDRDGVIRYIATSYDVAQLSAIISSALAD